MPKRKKNIILKENIYKKKLILNNKGFVKINFFYKYTTLKKVTTRFKYNKNSCAIPTKVRVKLENPN